MKNNLIFGTRPILEAINSGFKQAESLYGIRSGLILCGMRNDKSNVEKVGSIAIDYKELIIGFDIAGPELSYRPSLFKDTQIPIVFWSPKYQC